MTQPWHKPYITEWWLFRGNNSTCKRKSNGMKTRGKRCRLKSIAIRTNIMLRPIKSIQQVTDLR